MINDKKFPCLHFQKNQFDLLSNFIINFLFFSITSLSAVFCFVLQTSLKLKLNSGRYSGRYSGSYPSELNMVHSLWRGMLKCAKWILLKLLLLVCPYFLLDICNLDNLLTTLYNFFSNISIVSILKTTTKLYIEPYALTYISYSQE